MHLKKANLLAVVVVASVFILFMPIVGNVFNNITLQLNKLKMCGMIIMPVIIISIIYVVKSISSRMWPMYVLKNQ